jgi:baculoviral IAP repeat-containing protein 6
MGKDNACAVRSCCAEGRAIAIFEALGGLDRQFIKERSVTDSRVLAAVKKNNTKGSASNSVGPGGTGYGTGSGYGGHMPTFTGARRGKRKLMNNSTTIVADVAIPDWDKTLVAGLATLTALLPEPYAENAQVYDILPHASIGHLISLSQ